MIGPGRSRDSLRSLIRVALLFNMFGALARANTVLLSPVMYIRIVNFRAINKSRPMPRKERLKREREKERQTEAAKYWQLAHFWVSTMISIYKLSVDTLYLRSRPTDLGE